MGKAVEGFPLKLPNRSFSVLPSEADRFFAGAGEYRARLRSRVGGREFRIMWGPPFTNAKPHMGNLYSQLVKDFLAGLYHSIGYRVLLRPGFDCFGLPTEEANRKGRVVTEMDREARGEFYLQCLKASRINSIKQSLYYMRMGIVADWERVYHTASTDFLVHQETNNRLATANGHLRWGMKELDYCPKTLSVVPQSETETKLCPHSQLWFLLTTDSGISLMVFTTTPWSIYANVAVAYSPDLYYAVYSSGDSEFLAREGLTREELGVEPTRVRAAAGPLSLRYRLPGEEVWRPVIAASFVEDKGSGFVHLAGLYDERDHAVCTANGLEMIDLDHLFMTNSDEGFWNKSMLKRLGDQVLRYSTEQELLRFHTRSKHKVIRKVVRQCFLATTTEDFKAKVEKEIDEIAWYPQYCGANVRRFVSEGREDWCLSRNRVFNSPLGLSSARLSDRVAHVQHGGAGMDVWWDSANTFSFCYPTPADLVVEGLDQYKGYFLRGLQLAVATSRSVPFKRVLSLGFVVDKNQEKLSKSLANYEDVDTIIGRYGEGAVRCWALSFPTEDPHVLSDETLSRAKSLSRKVVNVMNFLAGYYDHTNAVPLMLLRPFDKWVVERRAAMVIDVFRHTLRLRPHEAFRSVVEMVNWVSSHYLEYVKGVLYTRDTADPERVCVVRTVSIVFRDLIWGIRPFLPGLSRALLDRLGDGHRLWSWSFDRSFFGSNPGLACFARAREDMVNARTLSERQGLDLKGLTVVYPPSERRTAIAIRSFNVWGRVDKKLSAKEFMWGERIARCQYCSTFAGEEVTACRKCLLVLGGEEER